MASIENRSRFVVSVANRDDLKQTFAYNREAALKTYIQEMKSLGLKPRLSRTNDSYAIRIREAGKSLQTLYAKSEQEALDIKERVSMERRNGLFVDYAKGRRHSLADLLVRYLREESPRHKGFEVEGYIINAMLADAGLSKVQLAEAFEAHKNPHPSLIGKVFQRKAGKRVRLPSPATRFIRKPFGDIVPEDINDYIDDRCQAVAADTVDREVDILSAVCHLAIDTWRIPVEKNPMDGVRRPRYFNERDRRLKAGEEDRLIRAAYEEDAQKSILDRLESLMEEARLASHNATTVYRRKNIIKSARDALIPEAERSYIHVPWVESFIIFQLMTGARRSETLSLEWKDVDFVQQTAFIAESKNGRPRKLPLRSDLIRQLQCLPRRSNFVFTILNP